MPHSGALSAVPCGGQHGDSALDHQASCPPIRSELVLRPRLIKRLNAGLGRKLTLVCAPPGFGKTTLLSAWAHSGGPGSPRFAWLSLDETDNDPIRFWRYVIAAVQAIDPRAERTALAALELWLSPSLDPLHVPEIEPLVTAWINHIATSELALADRPCVLVLEDYHFIDAEPIHRSLNLLLDYMPGLLPRGPTRPSFLPAAVPASS